MVQIIRGPDRHSVGGGRDLKGRGGEGGSGKSVGLSGRRAVGLGRRRSISLGRRRSIGLGRSGWWRSNGCGGGRGGDAVLFVGFWWWGSVGLSRGSFVITGSLGDRWHDHGNTWLVVEVGVLVEAQVWDEST